MKIQIGMSEVYGVTKVYPICDKARLFASIAGTKTLTERVLKDIEQLGYQLELVVSAKHLSRVDEVIASGLRNKVTEQQERSHEQ